MNNGIDRKSIYADLSLGLVAIIWGSSFIFMKNTLDYIGPVHIIALRFTIAPIILSLIFFKKLKTIKVADLYAGSIIGLVLFIAFITQTIGLQYTTVSNQAFITTSNVVIVPFLYWFISKNKPGIFEIIAVILCFIGIGVLSIEKNFTVGAGDLLTMVCAVFYAFHIVSVGIYAEKHDPIILTIVQFAVVGILSIIVSLIMKTPLNPLNKEVVFSIIYLTIIGTIVAFGIQNIAQKYTSSTHAALILSTESVFGSIFGIIILKEILTLKLFIGAILVFSSVIIAETKLNFIFTKENRL